MRSIFLSLSFIHFSFLAQSQDILTPSDKLDTNKINACFITINSDEEKLTFSKHLSTGPNKGKFNLIELNTQKQDWFKSACESNIRCDLLLISGEFSGKFFGDKGELHLEELEGVSCSEKCKGLLNDPKEVYLMGCNTLAGKDQDWLTAEQYLARLLNHNMPLAEAVQRTEERYGGVNGTTKARMQKIFKGVPHLYGFSSTGPSGKTVDPMIKKYLKSIPDYSKYITKLEVEKGLLLGGKVIDAKNPWIQSALSSTAITQCSGAPLNDGMDEAERLRCLILDPNKNKFEKLHAIKNVLEKGDIAYSLPDIQFFLSNLDAKSLSSEESKILNEIKTSESIQERFLKSMRGIKMPLMKLKYMDLAVQYHWAKQDEGKKLFRDSLEKRLVDPLTAEAVNFICASGFKGIVDTEFVSERLRKTRLLEKGPGWRIADCLHIEDTYVLTEALKKLHDDDSADSMRAIKALVKLVSRDEISILSLTSALQEVSPLKYQVLAELNLRSPLPAKVVNALIEKDELISNYTFAELFRKNKSSIGENFIIRLSELATGGKYKIGAIATLQEYLLKGDVLRPKEAEAYLKHVVANSDVLMDLWRLETNIPPKSPEVVNTMCEILSNDMKDLNRTETSLYRNYLSKNLVSEDQAKKMWESLKNLEAKDLKYTYGAKYNVLRDTLKEIEPKLSDSFRKEIAKSKLLKD